MSIYLKNVKVQKIINYVLSARVCGELMNLIVMSVSDLDQTAQLSANFAKKTSIQQTMRGGESILYRIDV